MIDTFRRLGSLPKISWPPFTKRRTLKLAGVIVALLFPYVFTSDHLVAQDPNSLQTAEQWEAIAKIRSQIANDHELQSLNFANKNGQSLLDTGDSLNLAGDEKFLAAENYQKASQLWEKAATAYISAGGSDDAQKALENARTAIAAAKRTLNDGVYFHLKAKEQYENAGYLDKKVNVLEKAARNLERLMKLK